jgi:probable HAF family extracellular repeat protein
MRPNGFGCCEWLRMIVAWLGFLMPMALLGQSLTWLGTLGGTWSYAYDISPDGRVVVGVAQNERLSPRPFLWTSAVGMRDLGTLGGLQSAAYGISADGAVVVGWAHEASGVRRALRWSAATTLPQGVSKPICWTPCLKPKV